MEKILIGGQALIRLGSSRGTDGKIRCGKIELVKKKKLQEWIKEEE